MVSLGVLKASQKHSVTCAMVHFYVIEGWTVAANSSKGTVRFAALELDLRGGEQRRGGAKPVHLPEHPFEFSPCCWNMPASW
jgi:hypothetical protein